MKVERFGTVGAGSPRRGDRASTASSGAFATKLSGQAGAPTGGTSVNTIAPIDSLLAIQEVEAPESKRRRAMKRGHDLLDELETLRNALLLGQITPAMLDRIQALASGRRENITDPLLEGLLNEIEIRVAVELAKMAR